MQGVASRSKKFPPDPDRAAYHWLRLAEMNSSRVAEQSRSEISELKSRIPSEEIAQLEQRVSREAQEFHRLALQKAPAEVRSQDVRTSRIAC
jgi:hypothetical protein